ncbi:hypothetical protein V5O48_012273 [Marasmius crinis-equi]|uniref:DUF6534 domain-containing protein n=1 Tax=Marasmius crinis-equi TaxID=585013 RepID=A0ABR3F393_9AGAR
MARGNVDSDSTVVEMLELTETPLFLGYIISFLLQGILIVQVFTYFLAFKTDRKYIKLIVWFVFVSEWVSTIIATAAACQSLMVYEQLGWVPASILFKALSPLCGLVVLIVHAFYCYRIFVLGARIVVPIVIFMLSIGQCVMLIVAGFKSPLGIGKVAKLHDIVIDLSVPAWLSLTAASDCLIAITLIILLKRASRSSPTAAAKTRIQTVMMICIETGSITGLAALVELAFYAAFRQSFIHFALFYVLPKLYSNCMMATLNARLALPGRTLRESQDGGWESPPEVPPLVAAMELKERTVSDSIGSVIDIRRASEVPNGLV